jgi:hypothetical protein
MLLMTPEGKKVVVDLKGDATLYDAPHNPPNTGTRYTSGTDLMVHKARSGNNYFYTYSWSMWQGSEDSYTLLTENEAREFILTRSQMAGHIANGVNESICLEYFPNLFDEDA